MWILCSILGNYWNFTIFWTVIFSVRVYVNTLITLIKSKWIHFSIYFTYAKNFRFFSILFTSIFFQQSDGIGQIDGINRKSFSKVIVRLHFISTNAVVYIRSGTISIAAQKDELQNNNTLSIFQKQKDFQS